MTETPKTFDQVEAELVAALGPLAFHPTAKKALEAVETLFRSYDARLHEMAVSIDNLQDRLGRREAGDGR